MYEDYIERGPGSFLGDFTGMPMSDEGRAKALRYSSSLPSMIERQCLAQSPWVGLYRPLAIRIWSEVDESGRVVAWVMGGDYLRDTVTNLDGWTSAPLGQRLASPSGFTTGHWEGDTLVARTTHVKTAWIRRGVGIPGSDQSTFTVFITRRENLLTITTIQEDPIYLTEPHVVSRVWEFDPRGKSGPAARHVQRRRRDPVARRYGRSGALPARAESGRGLHGAHLQHPEGSGDGIRAHALSRVSQDAAIDLQAAGVVRPLLLWMDRAAGTYPVPRRD